MTPNFSKEEAGSLRKFWVFHIMYGTHLGATDEEMADWRDAAADYINHGGPVPPLTLEEWRAHNAR